MTKPVVVHTERLNPTGVGIASHQGKPLLLPGTLPDELVSARVLGGGQHQFFGEVREWLSKSPHRQTPPCTVAGECGGCSLQHVSIDYQREWKRTRFLHGMKQAGLDHITVSPIRHMLNSTQYRSKAQFMMKWEEEEGWIIGLYAPRSHELVSLDDCLVQDELTESLLIHLPQFLESMGNVPGLRGVLARSNGEGMLLTWLLSRRPSDSMCLSLEKAANSIPGVEGVFINLSSPHGNTLLGQETVHLSGREVLTYRIADLVFSAGPVSFVQTTLEGAALLLEEVRSRAPQRMQHVVDLYGGVGFFALGLESRANRVTVVERDGPSAEDGKRNLGDRGTYLCGDVAELTEDIAAADCMVVDPPRAGLGPTVVRWIATIAKPEVLIYVSCSEASFIRDLEDLEALGYEAREVTPVDLFPHTPHLELVTHLHRAD